GGVPPERRRGRYHGRAVPRRRRPHAGLRDPRVTAEDAVSETFRIVSPVDGSVYAERPVVGPADAVAAVERAFAAWQTWRRVPLAERCRILERAVDRFTAEREAIAEELAWLMGRPIAHGGGEVRGFEERARTMLALAPRAL